MAATQQPMTSVEHTEERVLLTLNLTLEVDEMMEELADRIGGSKGDVFRKAIGLLKLASDARAEGKRVGIVEGDQVLDVEFIEI
ncbi:hypothetical protein BH23PLA1_BH23PLA1_23590 [soil metagenome]